MAKIPTSPEYLSKTASDPKAKTGSEVKRTGTGDFEKLLLDQLSPSSPSEEKPGVQTLPELSATAALRFTDLQQTRPKMTQKISQAIDRLDTYVQWLADPARTLKEAAGILDDTETELQRLEASLADAPDAELEGIMAHLSTVVAVERTKLLRGDYN